MNVSERPSWLVKELDGLAAFLWALVWEDT